MNTSEIDRIFDKLRNAEHGTLIKIGANESGKPVEGIIYDPGSLRPPGHEDGVFISVPSDDKHIYYLDPEASRQEQRLIVKLLPAKREKPTAKECPEDMLKEFDYLRQSSNVKRGGGAVGEACSKAKGLIDIGE